MRRWFRTAVLFVATALGYLATVTVLRVTGGLLGTAALRTGTADVGRCIGHGPVSQFGFGAVWECTATVRWSGSAPEPVTFPAGELRPGERDVPVFLSTGGRGFAPQPGRNDSAGLVPVGFTVGMLLGVLTIGLLLAAAWSLLRAVRPAAAHPARGRHAGEWPVDAADLAATPTPRIVTRVRLLGGVLGAAILCALLGSIAQYDAPRAEVFRSPWPSIGRAWLTGMPTSLLVVLGAVAIVLLYAMGRLAGTDAARLVRYGEPYLLRGGTSKADRRAARTRLAGLRAARNRQRWTGVLIGLALLGAGGWAVLAALPALSASAPVLVWVGALRDVVLLGGIGVAWLCTVQPKADRIDRLLARSTSEPSPTKRPQLG